MDPSTVTAAGIELWKIGGIAAVLLAIIVIGAYLMFRFLIKMIHDLGVRLNSVEDHRVNSLQSVIEANVTASHEVVAACRELRSSNEQVVEVLRSRPCLIETSPHPIARPVLPQTYQQKATA